MRGGPIAHDQHQIGYVMALNGVACGTGDYHPMRRNLAKCFHGCVLLLVRHAGYLAQDLQNSRGICDRLAWLLGLPCGQACFKHKFVALGLGITDQVGA